MNKFMQELASEVINYGGMAATRAEVFRDAREVCTYNARVKFGLDAAAADRAGEKAADIFAFGPRAKKLTSEETADRLRRGLMFDPKTRGPKIVARRS